MISRKFAYAHLLCLLITVTLDNDNPKKDK